MIALILVLFVLIWLWFQPNVEEFQELFGFSGYQKPVSHVSIDYVRDQGVLTDYKNVTASEGVTNEDIEKCTNVSCDFIKKETNLCVYAIETNKIEKYVNTKGEKMYKCKFMMTTTSTSFPFNFGIELTIMGEHVVKARTQPLYTKEDEKIKAYTNSIEQNFQPFSNVEEFSLYRR
jgi:hypothetical protein